MNDVVIIGGGISGLSLGWFLRQRGVSVRILEAAPEPGGSIGTLREGGWLAETGPNSTLQKPGHPDDALGRLIDGLGLSDRLRAAGGDAQRRYVLKGDRLHPLPASPPAFLATPLFGPLAKLRLLAEPFIGAADHEESIAQFVTRRLGRAFLDYAVEPFVSGVYAGDPETLSVRAAVPKIYALERDHGSLIRGAIALGRVRKGAGLPAGRLISFDAGMALLPRTIAGKLGAQSVKTGAVVTALEPWEGVWRVRWDSGDSGDRGGDPGGQAGQGGQAGNNQGGELAGDSGILEARRVVLAVPAVAAARLVASFCPQAARILAAIPYPPIVSAAIGLDRAGVDHPLDGFGFLAPRREGLRTLGALFSSTLFADRAPPEGALVTAFIGGMTDPEAAGMAELALFDQVRADLDRCLGIRSEAVWSRITRHPRAIPQYLLGHLDRMAELDAALAPFPRLFTRANWRDGISVGDCVRNAEALAATMAVST